VARANQAFAECVPTQPACRKIFEVGVAIGIGVEHAVDTDSDTDPDEGPIADVQ